MLVVLMVWNNVRNASHGPTARCIMQHSCDSPFLYLFFLSFSLIIPHRFSRCLSELIYVHVLLLFYAKVSICLTENPTVSFV